MASPTVENPEYYDEMGHPKLTFKGACLYLVNRIPSLKPPMDPIPNPFKLLAMLSGLQWLQFTVCDAPEFFLQAVFSNMACV